VRGLTGISVSEIARRGPVLSEGSEAPILLNGYRARDLAGRADKAEATAGSPSRAYSTAVRPQSVWLTAYRYSRLRVDVTPSTALPDDPRMMFEFVRNRARRHSPRRNAGDQSVRGIPEMRPHSASNASCVPTSFAIAFGARRRW
jgi:hypothetical protein